MKKISMIIASFILASCVAGGNGSQADKSRADAGSVAAEEKDAYQLFKAGDYKKAAEVFGDEAQDSKNPEKLFMQAESVRLSGKAEKSIAIYDQVLALDGYKINAMEGKGLALLEVGKINQAEEIFLSILEKDASNWRTINALGVISALNGREDEALEYFKMALDVNSSYAVLNNIGLSLALSDHRDMALDIMSRALSMVSGDVDKVERVEMNLALIYGVFGDMDKAESLLRKYLPEAAVYNNLGYYAKLSEDHELSKAYLSKAISSNPVYYEKAWGNL